MIEYSTHNNTKCKYNTDGVLNTTYHRLHLKWYNNRMVGAIGVRKTESDNIFSADIWFKRGYLDITFIDTLKILYKDSTILLQVKKHDLPARILASTCGFKKNKASTDMYIGYWR